MAGNANSGNRNPKGNPYPVHGPLPPTRGRPPGVPNKIGAQVKENVVTVFSQIGGIKTMVAWARRNKTEFYRMYSRLIPTQVIATVDLRDATEFSDAELVEIISSPSSGRIAGPQEGESVAGGVH